MEDRSEFVLRVADELRGTLSAGVALDRARMLTDEAKRLQDWFAKSPPQSPYSKWRTFPFDIITYFAVAYVTCLEWHARSRLTDLFTCSPSAIDDTDLSRVGGTKLVIRLIGSGASIPQYLAATPNISSADSYLKVFKRLFEAFQFPESAINVIRRCEVPADLNISSGLDAVSALFRERNALVHEINETNVGHPFHHYYWEFQTAIGYGISLQT